jgi:hypothetical protein
MNVVGSAAAAMSQGPAVFQEAEKKARELGRALASAIAEKRGVADQKERHAQTAQYFRRLVEMNRERWPHEYQHWQKKQETTPPPPPLPARSGPIPTSGADRSGRCGYL